MQHKCHFKQKCTLHREPETGTERERARKSEPERERDPAREPDRAPERAKESARERARESHGKPQRFSLAFYDSL